MYNHCMLYKNVTNIIYIIQLFAICKAKTKKGTYLVSAGSYSF
jgi:hypothetical protein